MERLRQTVLVVLLGMVQKGGGTMCKLKAYTFQQIIGSSTCAHGNLGLLSFSLAVPCFLASIIEDIAFEP